MWDTVDARRSPAASFEVKVGENNVCANNLRGLVQHNHFCRNIQKQPCCVLFAVEKVYTAGWRQTSNLETLLCVPRLLDGLSWSVVKRLLDAAPCGTGSSSAVSRFQLKPLGVHPPVVVTLSERSKPSYFRSCLPHTRCLKHDCRIKRDIHRMWLCSLLSAFYS